MKTGRLIPGFRARTVVAVLFGVMWATGPRVALPQSGTPSFDYRGLTVDEALQRYARQTGTSVAYESRLTRGLYSTCATRREEPGDVLPCILRGTGLDYFQLSSGTYVLARRAERETLYGYLTGVVRDAGSGQPVVGAHVLLNGRSVGTVTSSDGRFRFADLLPGRYEIHVSHIAYALGTANVAVGAGARASADVELHAQEHVILPLVVEAGTVAGSGVAPSLFTVSAAEGGLAGYRHAAAMAGVRINDVTADPLIDGAEAGDLQVRLDGVPLFLGPRVPGLIGPFGAFAIDRLTVYRAGYGARVGSVTAGVVSAEHALTGPERGRIQIDPAGLNGLARASFKTGGRPASAMLAGRYGLWDVYAPGRLKDALRSWTAPDAFLLVAPAERYDLATPSFLSDTLGFGLAATPQVGFFDLHGAVRVEPAPLHTVDASFYAGQNTLTDPPNPVGRGQQQASDASNARLTIDDDHRRLNTAGQLGYRMVVGSRSLLHARTRWSRYRLTHSYELVDDIDLSEFAGAADFRDVAVGATNRAADVNEMSSAALEVSLDHSRRRQEWKAGLVLEHRNSRFDLLAPGLPFGDPEAQAPAPTQVVRFAPRFVADRHRSLIAAAFAENTWSLGKRLATTSGLRLTYLPVRRTAYAEPRLSVRVGTSASRWSAETSFGLYRQFVTQLDISKLNAGALLSSVRVWLPVDATVRPPASLHVAQQAVLAAGAWRWTARAFARTTRGALIFDYPASTRAGSTEWNDQRDYLTGADARSVGATIAAERGGRRAEGRASYSATRSRRNAVGLFDGRSMPLPDEEPHRVDLTGTLRPGAGATLRLSWRSIWGRSWALRQAYYDFFGHDESARFHPGQDLGRPDLDRRPPVHQLDATVAIARRLGGSMVQFRIEMLNVLGRDNVLDYRLEFRDGALVRVPRPLLPRVISGAVQISF